MSDMTVLDPTVREFVDRVARKVLASAEVSEPLYVTIEDLGERTYRVGFHGSDEIKRLRDENSAFRAELNRLRAILDKLRKPSEDIRALAFREFDAHNSMRPALKAAVKAAEQEVEDE